MDNTFLSRIAYLHYIDNIPQNEIAKIMGISKSSVSRSLQTARDKGIVTIEVKTSNENCYYLEKKLEERYKLKRVVVIPSYTNNNASVLRDLGKAGATYLQQIVKNGMTISVAMGRTLSEIANNLSNEENVNCNIVPISGGLGQVSPELHANDICRRIADSFSGVAYPLYAPAIVSTESLREGIMGDRMIQQVFDMAINADYALVSVGNISDSTFLNLGIISQEESDGIKALGGIGDIGGFYFDANGEIIDADIHKRVVGPAFKELREKTNIILVAGSDSKKEVIKSSLLGELVDVLITDESVAKYLID